MALVVDATVGGIASNSYQTVTEIDDYFLTRVPASISAQWADADPADKAAAAVMATMWMDTLIHWTHYPTTPTQALLWPQYGQWHRNGWTMVPLDVIPRELKNCHAEIALYLLQDDRVSDFDPIKLGIRKLKAGSIDIEFREKIPVSQQPPVIPDTLFSLLVPSWVDYIDSGKSADRDLERA